jgi:hypothetical protein
MVQVTQSGKISASNNDSESILTLDGIGSKITMAQSRYFTIEIEGISFVSGVSILPVKNITYTVTGLDIMALTLGFFKDLPIPVGIRLPKLSLTLTDTQEDSLEQKFREWFNSYKPANRTNNGRYSVDYLDNLCRKVTYKSYSLDGTLNFSVIFPAMLAEDFTYTRDYEANELKTMEVTLLIAGEGIIQGKKGTNILPSSDNVVSNNNLVKATNDLILGLPNEGGRFIETTGHNA